MLGIVMFYVGKFYLVNSVELNFKKCHVSYFL